MTDTDPFVMLLLVEEIPSFRGLRIWKSQTDPSVAGIVQKGWGKQIEFI